METLAATALVVVIVGMVGVARIRVESPTMIFMLLNTVVAFGGYYLPFESDIFGLVGRTGADKYDAVFRDCCGLVIAFGVGALIAKWWLRDDAAQAASSARLFDRVPHLELMPTIAIGFLAMYILGCGPSELISRQEYMTQYIGPFKIIGGVFSLLCCLGLGVSSRGADVRTAVLSNVAVVLIEVAFLGYSSRSAAFGLVLFFLGRFYAVRGAFEGVLLSIAMALAPLLVQVSLFMRSASQQGLIALVEQISSGKIFKAFSYGAALDNFLFVNFYITSLTASIALVNFNHMWISLNPLPGSWVGWNQESNGIHPFIPYTSFGEWIAFSPAAGMAFYLLLGTLFEWLDSRRRSGDFIYAFLSPVFLICYTVLSLQYSTRSAIRLLYYLLAIIVLTAAVKAVRRAYFVKAG